jgi:hypothetical protein
VSNHYSIAMKGKQGHKTKDIEGGFAAMKNQVEGQDNNNLKKMIKDTINTTIQEFQVKTNAVLGNHMKQEKQGFKMSKGTHKLNFDKTIHTQKGVLYVDVLKQRLVEDACVTEGAKEVANVIEVEHEEAKKGVTAATKENYALDLRNPSAKWRRMDDLPVAQGITHGAFVLVGMKLYFCGG